MGFAGWPADREGSGPAGHRDAIAAPPKVIVTFVIDGGGWNVLQHWPDSWPNLKRLMGRGANYRNAITGSFPAVTACAHATIGTGTYPEPARHHRATTSATAARSARPTATPGTRTRATS